MIITSYVSADSTVLNPAISQKLKLARFPTTLWQSYDLHEISLTEKEDFLKEKYITGSMPLPTLIHNYKACSGPKAIAIPQF